MADDYSVADRAQLVAEGLGIEPASFAGREGDALVAMALVASYRRMTPNDQHRILYVINDDIGFGDSHPGFVQQCREALALMIANPDWVPGSLTNAELEDEIKFWRNIQWALKKLGYSWAGTYVSAKGRDVLKLIGDNVRNTPTGGALGLAPSRTRLCPR